MRVWSAVCLVVIMVQTGAFLNKLSSFPYLFPQDSVSLCQSVPPCLPVFGVSLVLQLFSCGQSVVSRFLPVHQLVASFLLRLCCLFPRSSAQDYDRQHEAEQSATRKDHQHTQEPAWTHTNRRVRTRRKSMTLLFCYLDQIQGGKKRNLCHLYLSRKRSRL